MISRKKAWQLAAAYTASLLSHDQLAGLEDGLNPEDFAIVKQSVDSLVRELLAKSGLEEPEAYVEEIVRKVYPENPRL